MVSAARGGNEEFQYYRNSRNNSYVRDGVLFLRPTLTASHYGEDFIYKGKLQYPDCNTPPDCVSEAGHSDIVLPIESARIYTKGTFNFAYGRLEIRAKMPKGDWIWPALWLMPEEDKFGTWPRSGEIDVAECRGNERLYDSSGEPLGVQKVSSTLHFGPNPNRRNSTHFEKKLKSGTAADDFHVYGMQWSEGGFRFTLDGEVIGEMPAPPDGFWKLGGFDKNPGGPNLWPGSSMSPFDQKFFIILNVAVGGRFFPDDGRNEPHPRPWDWGSPGGSGARAPLRQFWERRDWWLGTWHGEDAALQVDYVKVFSN